MFWYILFVILFFLLFVFLIPLKIEFIYEVDSNLKKEERIEQLNSVNYINFYILNFIKVKQIKRSNEKKSKAKGKEINAKVYDIIYNLLIQYLKKEKIDESVICAKDLKKIKKNMYYEKIDLSLGINLNNVILNAYIISFLNAVLNIFFAKNADKINFSKTSYTTFISNKIINIKIDSIIKVKLVNTIGIIIKLIIRYRKVVKKDGRTTSNRKLNVNSYDFA